MTDKPFGVDTLLPASVRRAAQAESQTDGPKPKDRLPEMQAFAERFMEEAGLEYLSREDLEERREPDGPMLFSPEFFDAQMEVII
jgi:hypothetical protein